MLRRILTPVQEGRSPLDQGHFLQLWQLLSLRGQGDGGGTGSSFSSYKGSTLPFIRLKVILQGKNVSNFTVFEKF
jgi:hypothetical protein